MERFSESDCPSCCVPVPVDLIPDGDLVRYADAQATIAALQARVQELEQWVQDQSTANLETMRHMDEMQSRAMDAESQLTQRTAELEAAQREARLQKEVEAALSSKVVEYEVELNGDPQNFYGRGRTVGLRTLVLALPKVEGEVTVRDITALCWANDGTYGSINCKEQLVSLLKHRQGMEG